jgi:hypothetical protein
MMPDRSIRQMMRSQNIIASLILLVSQAAFPATEFPGGLAGKTAKACFEDAQPGMPIDAFVEVLVEHDIGPGSFLGCNHHCKWFWRIAGGGTFSAELQWDNDARTTVLEQIEVRTSAGDVLSKSPVNSPDFAGPRSGKSMTPRDAEGLFPPMVLTPGQDAQLVKEGVLPPRGESTALPESETLAPSSELTPGEVALVNELVVPVLDEK